MRTHLQKFQQKWNENSGAALISSPQNQFYLSGFPFEDGYLLIFPDAAYLLTDFRYREAAERAAGGSFEVLTPAGHFAAVAELLAKHGAKTLFFEENAMTMAAHDRWATALAGVTLVGGLSAIFTALRRCKDETELAAMAAAQDITDAAFTHILDYLKANVKNGVREIDVALELEFFMRKNGAEGLAFNTIAVSGTASSLPHGVPRAVPLENGFLTMDFGARYGGYCSDMTRTVVIGKASAEVRRVYETVLAAQKAALAAAHAGMGCRALDKVARDIIENAGYAGTFGHSLGHGVGIDIHENPRVAPKAPEDEVLEAGVVVTAEPGIYLAGKYGCRIEDMYAVNADGTIRNFTHSPKELIEI